MGVNKMHQNRSNESIFQIKDKIFISPLTDDGIKLLTKSQKARKNEKKPVKLQILGIYRCKL
jgi:hypothetical protein